MTDYKTITSNTNGIKTSLKTLTNIFLQEPYYIRVIFDSITKDLEFFSGSLNDYFTEIDIKIKSDGLHLDLNRYLKRHFNYHHVTTIPTIAELNKFLDFLRKMKSPNELKKLSYPFDNMYSYYMLIKAKHFETFKKEAGYYYPKPNELSKSAKKKYHRKINKKAEELVLENFQRFIREQFIHLSSMIPINDKKLPTLETYCNIEKIYYHIAKYQTKPKRNTDITSNISYIRDYIEHIRPYLKSDNTIDHSKIGFGYNDKTKYDVTMMINFLEQNSTYHFKKEEPKRIIKNLEIYDYNFLDAENTKLVREQLGHYIRIGENHPNKDLGELLKRKSKYFLSLNPDKIKQGINRYEGYIGFVIEDKVILEHFFKNIKTYEIVDEEAIYIIDDKDFEKITHMGKLDVIAKIKSGEINAIRIFHTGDWEKRVDKVLSLKKS